MTDIKKYERGGWVYSWAYNALRKQGNRSRIILGENGFFHVEVIRGGRLTDLFFETCDEAITAAEAEG